MLLFVPHPTTSSNPFKRQLTILYGELHTYILLSPHHLFLSLMVALPYQTSNLNAKFALLNLSPKLLSWILLFGPNNSINLLSPNSHNPFLHAFLITEELIST